MKNEDLLRAIGNVDDELIIMAEQKSDNKEDHRTAAENKASRVHKKTVYRWAGAAAAVLAVFVGVAALLGGMRAGSAAPMDAEYSSSRNSYGFKGKTQSADIAEAEMDYSWDKPSENAVNEALPAEKLKSVNETNTKLIYSAEISLQTLDFNKTADHVTALAERLGGYVENCNINNGSIYSSSKYCSGQYTIRIPAENFENFLSGAGDGCHVFSLSRSVKDVGETYFELESRLETLRIKEERLQELLKAAKNMADIITIQNELSNTEAQIDYYASDINHYDALINYSTVNIYIDQVNELSNDVTIDESFGARVARSFKNGLINFGEDAQDFIAWLGYNIIPIVLIAAAIIVIWRYRLIRKLINCIMHK